MVLLSPRQIQLDKQICSKRSHSKPLFYAMSRLLIENNKITDEWIWSYKTLPPRGGLLV